MILRLRENYCLRGWKGAACGVVDRQTAATFFVEPARYSLLLLCDGVMNLTETTLSEEERAWLHMLLEKKVLEQLDAPCPRKPVQEYVQYENRYIQSVQWSVTGRCNFNCRHCYMDAPNGTLGEISHEEAMQLIDEMAACGVQEILLTGGELFVRSDIWELIEQLTERGIRISQIYTNGWLVNRAVLDRLDALGQKPEFSFSFDGIGWHDWMRRVKGSEERVLDAIELCHSRGFRTSIEMCLHRGSLESLRETVRRMGAMDTRVKVGNVMNTELWLKNSEGYALTYEEYLDAIVACIDTFFADGMPAELTLGGVIHLHKGSAEYRIIAEKHDGTEACREHYLCGAAKLNAYITPDGRLLPCMPMTSWEGHTRFGKIRETGLKQALTDGFYTEIVRARVKDLLERNRSCGDCEYKLRCCGGCRACALEADGDLFGKDPMQCFFWQNGYVERIRQAAETAIGKYVNG